LNVAYLYDFHKGEKSDEISTLDEWKKQLPVKPVEEMEEILAKRVGKETCRNKFLEYLIKWKRRIIRCIVGVLAGASTPTKFFNL
jgi:hypothetical protein